MWEALKFRAAAETTSFRIRETFLDTVDEALSCTSKDPTLLVILATAIQNLWQDRNHLYFQEERQNMPVAVLIQLTRNEVESSVHDGSVGKRAKDASRAKATTLGLRLNRIRKKAS
ncbi:hypothetical protein R1flu_013623 [Riccia fluitans]|uniref:Uncharacterized protein n=1 Tax=Riccia fluitans TaxID=41844 RepID=A0ABD1YDY3_9MARC